MQSEPTKPRVIAGDRVRRIAQPVIVDCVGSGDAAADQPITVVPIVDGDVIAGLEIRCRCGAGLVIECLYEEGA